MQPVINLSVMDLTESELALAKRILGRENRLRASKPKVNNDVDPDSGRAAYLWRMVAFTVSTNSQHHCMPVTADYDLPNWKDRESRKAMEKELDALANKIVKHCPQPGLTRWARAFGVIN